MDTDAWAARVSEGEHRVPLPEEQPTVSVETAAEVLGISRSAGYAGVRSGEIPSIKIGRRIVVPTAALRRMLQLDDVPAQPA